MSGKQILVVEDEPKIAETLIHVLNEQDFEATRVATILEAREALKVNVFSAIVLDVKLPDGNGFEFCKELRKTNDIPILFLTSISDEVDKIVGLEIGADDYVTKPFSLKVLEARIAASIRKYTNKKDDPNEEVSIQGIRMSNKTRDVKIDNVKIGLTFTEFQILHLLASHPGWVFTRYQIIEKIRGDGYPVTDRSVDFQIVGLRKKMKNKGKLIETIRGVGYRFHYEET